MSVLIGYFVIAAVVHVAALRVVEDWDTPPPQGVDAETVKNFGPVIALLLALFWPITLIAVLGFALHDAA